MSVLVFGSLNMDLVTRTPRLPQPGETLMGHQFTTVPGGKGANQAVAVAKLGVSVQMVGRVGKDDFGQALITSLQTVGVDCAGVAIDGETSSGIAAITVDDQGENHIIVVPGANGQVNPTDVTRLSQGFAPHKILLLQLEIPLPMVTAAAEAAHQAGMTVILDPAPAPTKLPADLYSAVDILTPNQVEASQLTGLTVEDEESAVAAAEILRSRGVATVIVKLGAKGAVCVTAEDHFIVPPVAVVAIDTVAAGDAFNGGLAAGLAEGLPLVEACRWAAATGALSVTRTGAQSSMPNRAEILAIP